MPTNQAHENVDYAEINKFAELASRWWDPSSEFKPLHDINPLRLDYIDNREPVKGKRILDIGCGGGILSEGLAAKGAIVTAIDMGEAPLAVARLHLKESSLEVDYQKSTAEAIADTHSESFDIVTCLEMLEHVPDPESIITASRKLVKPGGAVFFSTINRNPKSWLFAIVGAEYMLKLLPKGTHDYEKFIRPSEMELWCRRCGLTMQDIIGMHYNPITRSYTLGQGIDVNYIAYTRSPEA
ncbi:bifunctional 2-polyprenyl-6-hydroxyphenol methylase/3-demethylubiquinol 3-O-methyltransferase UbiG [Pseudomonadota bacterium]